MAEAIQFIEKLSLLAFLVSSMVATGLSLDPRAALSALRDVRFVSIALALNFLLAPALALLLIRLIPLEKGLANGLLLLGGAAGAPFLPKLLAVAKADLARGVALMALLTAGTIIFLPLALPLEIPGVEADPWRISRPLLGWIVVPLLVGVVANLVSPGQAIRAAPSLSNAAGGCMLLFFVLLVATNAKSLLALCGSGALLAAALHAGILFIAGWWLGGPSEDGRSVLGLGSGARNFGAAMVPATSSLRDPQALLMIAASAVVGCLFCFSAAVWAKRRRIVTSTGLGL
ncbi:hypothetical protein [Haloferula sp. BvORR071]|uniref:hypothetical protein n=1 Tax=Haloferula sp. BvORR071 TaxID=1396141 RepID=UPI000696E8AF|nr:hypothetical protein [Haloferula sp. BvORR071]